MAMISTSKRARRGAKKLDLNTLREALRDGRVWAGIGVVRKFDGEASHFEILEDDVLVDVELAPGGEKVACRLGAGSGGGLWKIPAVGAEVAVLIPQGELDADPLIVATLASGAPPEELDGDDVVVVKAARVVVKATGGPVTIEASGDAAVTAGGAVTVDGTSIALGGATSPLEGVVNGQCVDSFTGTPYAALHALTGKVKAVK